MKFIADENLPQVIIRYISSREHEVLDLKKSLHQGILDINVCKLAQDHNSIIVTYDKDFLRTAETIPDISVILLSFPRVNPKTVIPWVEELFDQLEAEKIKKPFILTLFADRIEMIQ